MGAVLNNHTNFLPADRAEAEAIARDKQLAVSKLFEAGSWFDEAGRVYWLAETDRFGPALDRAVNLLRDARDLLASMIQAEIALNTVHNTSEKLLKAIELGLDKDEYDYARFTARSVQHAQRLIAGLDHVLSLATAFDEASQQASLEKLYTLISTPYRHLLTEACDYMAAAIRDARVTHEVSAIVEQTWAREGRPEDKRAHLTGEPILATTAENR